MSATAYPAVLACWRCGYEFTHSTRMDAGDRVGGVAPSRRRGAPVEGDVSVCIRCGAVALYGPGGTTLRRCSAEEEDELMSRPEVLEISLALREAWERGAR